MLLKAIAALSVVSLASCSPGPDGKTAGADGKSAATSSTVVGPTFSPGWVESRKNLPPVATSLTAKVTDTETATNNPNAAPPATVYSKAEAMLMGATFCAALQNGRTPEQIRATMDESNISEAEINAAVEYGKTICG